MHRAGCHHVSFASVKQRSKCIRPAESQTKNIHIPSLNQWTALTIRDAGAADIGERSSWFLSCSIEDLTTSTKPNSILDQFEVETVARTQAWIRYSHFSCSLTVDGGAPNLRTLSRMRICGSRPLQRVELAKRAVAPSQRSSARTATATIHAELGMFVRKVVRTFNAISVERVPAEIYRLGTGSYMDSPATLCKYLVRHIPFPCLIAARSRRQVAHTP